MSDTLSADDRRTLRNAVSILYRLGRYEVAGQVTFAISNLSAAAESARGEL